MFGNCWLRSNLAGTSPSMLLPTWGRGRRGKQWEKWGTHPDLRNWDQLCSKQFQAVFYLPSVVFGSCEWFAATSMPYFPSKMLTKFLVSVTSCGNELFATAYGKCQHERERQKPRDRQNSGLECPLMSLFVPGKAQPWATQVSYPAQATALYTKGNPSENYRGNYTKPCN